jgi:hypothetical protein
MYFRGGIALGRLPQSMRRRGNDAFLDGSIRYASARARSTDLGCLHARKGLRAVTGGKAGHELKGLTNSLETESRRSQGWGLRLSSIRIPIHARRSVSCVGLAGYSWPMPRASLLTVP